MKPSTKPTTNYTLGVGAWATGDGGAALWRPAGGVPGEAGQGRAAAGVSGSRPAAKTEEWGRGGGGRGKGRAAGARSSPWPSFLELFPLDRFANQFSSQASAEKKGARSPNWA